MEAPKATVLVVDDDPLLVSMLETFLISKGYLCYGAHTVREAVDTAEKNHVDLSIVDIFLGNESGVDIIKNFTERKPNIPCIVITGIEDEKIAKLALDAGAYGYLNKPFSLLELLVNIEGVLRRRRLESLKDRYRNELEAAVNEKTKYLQVALDSQYRLLKGVIKSMAEVVEVRDPYTSGHQYRTAALASAISKSLGLPKETTEVIYLSALLHDIGKISVPAEILTKPGKLNRIEFELVKCHTIVGYRILKNIPFPFPIHDIVIQHHERLDGSGYPRGLKGDQILMESKIIAVADVVEAMMTHRPYRPALGLEKTLEEISNQKGKLFDPDVVRCCVNLFQSQGFTFSEKGPFPLDVQGNGENFSGYFTG